MYLQYHTSVNQRLSKLITIVYTTVLVIVNTVLCYNVTSCLNDF